jgi:hypothetical protein
MRLDARKGDTGWQVYDAKRCRKLEFVVWLDNSDATWGEFDDNVPGRVIVRQEDRITIYQSRRLVIFNEIDGVNDEQDQVVIERHAEVTA